jgi:hypothetical protein
MSKRIVDIADATPRPWKRSCFLITGPHGDHVTHTGYGNLPPSRSHESEANAELILRACNAFDLFIAGAKEALEQAKLEGYTVEALEQALAIARGEQVGGEKS